MGHLARYVMVVLLIVMTVSSKGIRISEVSLGQDDCWIEVQHLRGLESTDRLSIEVNGVPVVAANASVSRGSGKYSLIRFAGTSGGLARKSNIVQLGTAGMQQVLDEISWGTRPPVRGTGTEGNVPDGQSVPFLLTGGSSFGVLRQLVGGGSIGRHPANGGWVVFGPGETTPGRVNAVPKPVPYLPRPGAHIAEVVGHELALSWTPDVGCRYRLQIADDGAFVQCSVDTALRNSVFILDLRRVGPSLHWRIKAVMPDGVESGWSQPSELAVDSYTNTAEDGMVAMATTGTNPLGVPALASRKDTRLLCLDWRDPSDVDWPQSATCTPWNASCSWKGPHTGPLNEHGFMKCWATAGAMLNRYYGGDLTIDEMNLALKGGGAPVEDFQHAYDFGYGGGLGVIGGDDVIEFALLIADGTAHRKTSGAVNQTLVTQEIDAGRPLLWEAENHYSVVDGYRTQSGQFQIRVVNFDNNGTIAWRSLSSYKMYAWTTDSASGRSGDTRIALDSDGDGICDYDEVERFGTNRYSSDSDGDGTPDIDEVARYTFYYWDTDGDNDGDSHRDEVDPTSWQPVGVGLIPSNRELNTSVVGLYLARQNLTARTTVSNLAIVGTLCAGDLLQIATENGKRIVIAPGGCLTTDASLQ